jgi:hypothetical protein
VEQSPSRTEVVGELSGQLSELVRKELELAQAEMRQGVRRSAVGLAKVGGAAGCGVLAVASLHGGLTGALAKRLPPTVAGALSSLLYGAAAAVLARSGLAELRRNPPVPRMTVETRKEDMRWAVHPTRSERT